jgi:hypothetical protein
MWRFASINSFVDLLHQISTVSATNREVYTDPLELSVDRHGPLMLERQIAVIDHLAEARTIPKRNRCAPPAHPETDS